MERAGSPDPYDFNFDEAWQMRTWHAARHLRRAKEKLRKATLAYNALGPSCTPEEREKAARRLRRAEKKEYKHWVAYWSRDDPEFATRPLYGDKNPPEPAPAAGSSANDPIVIE